MVKPYSYRDVADVGLTTDAWSGFPKLPVNRSRPHLFPLGSAELVINFHRFAT